MPARRSLFSGLAPAAHGAVGMTGIPFDVPAKLPALLRDAGYQTELVAKAHLPPGGVRHGFDHARFAEATRGDWGSCRYTEFLMRHGHFDLRPGAAHGVHSNSWVGRPSHLPEELTHAYWCITEALDFLEHRDPSCPFFLNVGFIDPHPPFTPPAFYYDRYIQEELPAPAIGDWARGNRPSRHARRIEDTRIDLGTHESRAQRAAYYGLINHIDSQVGRLLQYLKDRRLLGDTLVLFTSDHGEMLGDHYLAQKARPFEGSARVPLLIAPPVNWRLAPIRTEAPVGLQDIMPTLLDAAGVSVPGHCTGRSLMPLVRGEDMPPRDVLHGEHADQYGMQEGMHYLTDGRHKYIWYVQSGRELLFDLRADPTECHDLAQGGDADQRLSPWRERLITILENRPEGFIDDGRLVAGRPYGRIMPDYRNGTVLPFI
jgi:arylsulfatase A-like enzyme